MIAAYGSGYGDDSDGLIGGGGLGEGDDGHGNGFGGHGPLVVTL